jgi:hypothetical protein
MVVVCSIVLRFVIAFVPHLNVILFVALWAAVALLAIVATTTRLAKVINARTSAEVMIVIQFNVTV